MKVNWMINYKFTQEKHNCNNLFAEIVVITAIISQINCKNILANLVVEYSFKKLAIVILFKQFPIEFPN